MDFKTQCDAAYENGTPIIEDDVYDSLFGSNAPTTSAKFERNTRLPVWMGSLDKVRSEKALQLWVKKMKHRNFVITEKLDGISALLFAIDGVQKLYTRGNGVLCCDISRFLPFLQLPAIQNNSVGVRGELIMKNSTFASRFAGEYKNARNLVAGQFGSKNASPEAIRHVQFIAHELIEFGPDCTQQAPGHQLRELQRRGFATPRTLHVSTETLTQKQLTSLLENVRKQSDYTSDGLVIALDAPYRRETTGNPKHAVSFKEEVTTGAVIATVKSVVWSPSSKNVWIPVVHIEPVHVSGVTISKVTGHNARFIVDSRIGAGAKILCTRSGDVIPHIVRIVEPSEEPIQLPSNEWRGVNVVTLEPNSVSDVKVVTKILAELGVKNVNLKTVQKLYDEAGVRTFFDVLSLTEDALARIFQERTRNKIYSELARIKATPHEFAALIGASGVLGYGIGKKRIELLLQNHPRFPCLKPQMEDLLKIEGISNITAELVLKNYEDMRLFLRKCKDAGLTITWAGSDQNAEQPQANQVEKKTICVSGFRDKTLEQLFHVVSSVTKKCDALVIATHGAKKTTKHIQAEKLGVPIILKENIQMIR